MSYKLVILVRSDLNMSPGKIVAQTAHATVDATIKSYTGTTNFWKWKNNGETIVALKVQSKSQLLSLIKKSKKNNIKSGCVIDYGLTEIEPNTITVGFIGPDLCSNIDKITGQLSLL